MGIFSIGNKTNYTDIFTSDITQNDNYVFGELSVVSRDSCYRMQYSSNIKNKIIDNYLDSIFSEELHCLHPYEFFKNYGGFIVRDFTTGGKISALYAGRYIKSATTEIKTRDMNSEINSSFKLGNTGSDNASLSLGRGTTSTLSTTKQFSSVKMSIKALGGSPAFPSFTIPTEVGTTQIDLSSWMASLENKNNTTLIEFNDDGLIPMTDFILEDNLKKEISSYINGYIINNTEQIEPYIMTFILQGNSPLLLRQCLVTRNNSVIHLSDTMFYHQASDGTDNDIEAIIKWCKKSEIWGMRVIGFLPSGNSRKQIGEKGDYANIVNHFPSYKRMVHNNILYIIDEIDKVGFSIPNDKRYIDQYAFKIPLESLAPATISFSDLFEQKYIINAL